MKKLVGLILGAILLLGVCSTLQAESWNTPDKILLGTYLIGETIDVLQIHEILHNNRFHELNPLIKSDRDLAISAVVTTGIIIWLAHRFEEHRTKILAGCNFIKWGMVGRNFSIGVRF